MATLLTCWFALALKTSDLTIFSRFAQTVSNTLSYKWWTKAVFNWEPTISQCLWSVMKVLQHFSCIRHAPRKVSWHGEWNRNIQLIFPSLSLSKGCAFAKMLPPTGKPVDSSSVFPQQKKQDKQNKIRLMERLHVLVREGTAVWHTLIEVPDLQEKKKKEPADLLFLIAWWIVCDNLPVVGGCSNE